MPTEVSLPNLATYVVRDEKEGDARYEEIPVSDIGYNQYETLGIPNEAVQYDKLNAPSSSTNPSKDLGNLNGPFPTTKWISRLVHEMSYSTKQRRYAHSQKKRTNG